VSEELLQRNLLKNPEKTGVWDFYNIGSTTLNELKNAKIIPQKDYKGLGARKPDGIIALKQKVIAVIENKSIAKFKTDKHKSDALKQGIDVARVLNAKILILTNTLETVWINVLNEEVISDIKGQPLKTVFEPNNQDIIKLIEQILESIDKDNSQIIEPRLKDPTKLAKSVWQDLWMAAGATPENCLYSFVELFIFKYLSDLGILKNHLSYDFLMNMFEDGNENEVLKYYADNIRKYIKKELFPVTSADNTTIINGTIFVSKDDEAVDGFGTTFYKILKKFGDEKEGGGELKNIDKDFKSRLFETFLKESISKKNWGQYFTPLKVVRSIVKMAESEIKEGITICDPACGVGKFLLEPLLINNNIEHFYKPKWEKTKKNDKKEKKLDRKITLIGMDKGFDKEEQKTIILAKANMLIYMSEMIRKHSDITHEFSRLFNDTFELKTKNILGILRDIKYEGEIDLILTNPPYVTTGSSNLKEEIIKSGIQAHYKVNAMGVEGLFMEWIIRALKPGGKAFVVVPDGIFNRQNDKSLRQFILDECIIDGIISLPLKTFFTTQKKTYILCMTKKSNNAEKQTVPVFTYLVSEIGESRDIYRFKIDHDDLAEAVSGFNQFKNAKETFKFNDPRCKIQPIVKFNSEAHWNVERWWTREEQVELGIAEEEKLTKFEEFPAIIEEVANNILNFREEILQLNEKKNSEIYLKTFRVHEIFNIERGNGKYIKRYIDEHKGNFAVYSGNTFNAFAFIDTFDYNKPCISWAIDGLAGYLMVHHDKFSATNHRGILLPRFNTINLEYAKLVLEPLFRKIKKGRIGTDGSNEYTSLPPFMVKDIEFSLPIDTNGNIDIEKQNEIVKKYEYISELKKKIYEYKKRIEELNIDISIESPYKEISINEFFDFRRGRVISKKNLIDNAGEYPVYSSNTKENGIFGYLKTFDFDCEGITWTTDGIYAGTTFYRHGKFSITNVCGLITVKKEFADKIYLPFINAMLDFRGIATGTANKKVMTNVILNSHIIIKVPVDINGFIDVNTQKEIAEKYGKFEQIKKNIVEELDKIGNIAIEYE
jgi:type I restriction-modification system DNA methylase subunit